jgi:hypothetical protein
VATTTVVLRRPTVAVDSTALAVDERLRAFDALFALWPMYWAALGLTVRLDLRDTGVAGLVIGVGFVLMLLNVATWASHPDGQVRYGLGRFGRRT